jgi:hypothetical protein
MTRIVTNAHRCKRPAEKRVNATASGHAQRTWLVAAVAAATLLAGCTADARPSDQELARRGYWYHDGNHEGGTSGQASPQAIYNATHGVWLWPPAENDIPPN